jgi:aldose 1-epimerase
MRKRQIRAMMNKTTAAWPSLPTAAGQQDRANGGYTMSIARRIYGQLPDGRDVSIFTLRNAHGVSVEIMNYGGIVTSICVPDRNGSFADIALGFDDLAGYLNNRPYFGAIIGRFANRIAHARFTLNGVKYDLNKNAGDHHLHGGLFGFDKVLWDAAIVTETARGRAARAGEALALTYVSPDCEEHYPGRLTVKVIYELLPDDELKIDYFAVSDQDTVVNLTNHSYFNLSGQQAGSIDGHWLQLNAASFTPVWADGIPTGEIRRVQGTALDFTRGALIGPGMAGDDEQVVLVHGFDHNFVLDKSGPAPQKAAEVYEPTCGRVLEVFTTQPAIQFYSGNFLDGSLAGKNGCPYPQHAGLCLETQYFPDSINRPGFPSPVLRAGELYDHTTIYRFSCR